MCIRWVAVACCWPLALFLASDASGQAKHDNSLRRYREGPLKFNDFRGKIPDERSGLDALTHTNIAYDLRYRSRSLNQRFEVTLTKIDVYAVMSRTKSWNRQETNKALLDHEQGHFDITQRFAVLAQMEMSKRIKSGRGPTAVGSSIDEAKQRLDAEIQEIIKPIFDASSQQQIAYDRVTRHGTLEEPQAEQRKKQIEDIRQLTESSK